MVDQEDSSKQKAKELVCGVGTGGCGLLWHCTGLECVQRGFHGCRHQQQRGCHGGMRSRLAIARGSGLGVAVAAPYLLHPVPQTGMGRTSTPRSIHILWEKGLERGWRGREEGAKEGG